MWNCVHTRREAHIWHAGSRVLSILLISMESLSEIIRQTRLIGWRPAKFIAKAELFELAWRHHSDKNQDSHQFSSTALGVGLFFYIWILETGMVADSCYVSQWSDPNMNTVDHTTKCHVMCPVMSNVQTLSTAQRNYAGFWRDTRAFKSNG